MQLIGYIRVSSDSQAENTSLEEQEKRIRDYCSAMGHQLVGLYSEVGSGKDTENRPVFNEALQAIADADGLIAVKLDRVARNTRDVLTLVEDVLQPQDKALVLLDLNVDTSTPTGRMILTIMASVAQLERDTINERTQGGRRAKAAKGGFAYGSPPFGFDAVDGQLVENAREQEIIVLIRRHKRSGKSLRDIAGYLNGQGITTKRGKAWQANQVKDILDRCKAPAKQAS